MYTKQFTTQQKNLTNKILKFSIITALSIFFSSCKSKEVKPVIIWTDNTTIASYAELYNSTHKDAKVVVAYKKEPAHSIPPQKDETPPDIIIGPWLKNSSTRKYFSPLDILFDENSIKRENFYTQVLNYGIVNEKQYLIPISFNLPTIIFSKKNESLIQENHFLNLNQIKTYAGNFNKKNKNGSYIAMGFAPSWEPDFLYLSSKINGANYREKGISFSSEEKNMQSTISYLKEWTIARNTDTESEQNFQFRYLYMPKYKQVNTSRCLFAYTTSDKLFTLTEAQSADLSFRWIEQDSKIYVEDDIITLGLYKKSKNKKQAEKFIIWFLKEDTQKQLIERTEEMKLNTVTFGIAGGFSSLKNVNEKIYPSYYRQLLGNLPSEKYLTMPRILPYHWPSLKSQVIIPYLQDNTNTNNNQTIISLEDRINDWTKQYF